MQRRRRQYKPTPVAPKSPSKTASRRGWRLFNLAAIGVGLGLAYVLFGPHSSLNLARVDLQAAVDPDAAADNSATSQPDETQEAAAPVEKNGKRHKASKTPGVEAESKGKPSKSQIRDDRAEEDQFFDAQGVVPYFKFDFIPEEWEYIHKDPRRYAECTMMEGDDAKVWKGVAVKLKGSAGSFQGPDAKPGLSISMNKYQKAERWNGFLKWHLNNGAQDNSFLNEEISCEMARKAGVPASRCAHALVKWQGRDLGLFVFKEAFDKDFLAKFFKNTDGDLYDGGFVSEINQNMEKDQGDPLRRDNIKELIAACQEGDVKKRWERLAKVVDIEEYLSFIAIESITCHWDGYNFNRNNYRLYFDVDSGKATFFLHGTDQTFGDANFPVTRESGAMVGQAIMSNPEWKQAYRARVQKIYDEILKPIDWPGRVVEVGEKVRAAIALRDERMAKEYENRIKEARDRVANRIAGIAKQLGDMPSSMKFDPQGVAKLGSDGWSQQGEGAAMDGAVVDGRPCLHIRANGASSGSWRKTLTLQPGKYRLVGHMRTAGVISLQNTSGEGAGLRISGSTRVGLNAANGDTPWKDVRFEFDCPGGDVVLVAELRATKGDAWFERDTFRLEQVH